jgi:hypothetical protein
VTQTQKNLAIVGSLLIASSAMLMLVPFSIQARLLYGARQMPQRELERVIAENVQTGASPERVLHFLDGQHLRNGGVERLTQNDSDKRYYPVGTLMVRAIKNHTASGVIGFQSLRIIFVFSENRELIRFDVRPIYTAP